jgi:hypothetical protein
MKDISELYVIIIMETTTTDSRVKPLYRGTQIIWYFLDIIEILLAFRFILKLLGANPNAGFTSFIYAVTYPFAEPFISVFRTTHVSGATFEWTTILAMFVYWLIAWGIIRLIVMGKPVSRYEASDKLNKQDVQP